MERNLSTSKPVIEGSANHILQDMLQAGYGEHNLLIYPDLTGLREIYSRYFNSRLKTDKGIVILLTTYETVEAVRRTLMDHGINASRFEKDGSLIILDSVAVHLGSYSNTLSTVENLAKRAENRGKYGCSMVADMGSFNLTGREHELLKYETSLPLKIDPIKCNVFCAYHQADFNRLSGSEQRLLFEHHLRNLIISETN
jgi:MEDS: MEthanogen/methylotroph, DcmR Sensory domain